MSKKSNRPPRPGTDYRPNYRIDEPIADDPFSFDRSVIIKVSLGTTSRDAYAVTDRIGPIQIRRRRWNVVLERAKETRFFARTNGIEMDDVAHFVRTGRQPIQISQVPTNVGEILAGLVATGYSLVDLHLLIEEVSRDDDPKYSLLATFRRPEGDALARAYEAAHAGKPDRGKAYDEQRSAEISFADAQPKLVDLFREQSWGRVDLFNNWARSADDVGTISLNLSQPTKRRAEVRLGYREGQFLEISEPLTEERYNRITGQDAPVVPEGPKAPTLAVPIEEHVGDDVLGNNTPTA